MKDQVKQIHFVGIGGVGMAGIAEVCISLGYRVSGSDIKENPTVERLKSLGAMIQNGHAAAFAKSADVLVVSSAIPQDNPEVDWAREARIPVIPRAAMLAELMRMQYGIAIAGTHGKTTTTSLAAAVLTQGGVDPTYVIGGKLNKVGSNARLGSSKYLVAEADESDASFLHLTPMMSVVTNIDEDHMDTYHGDYQVLENTFVEFIHRLPFYGLAILCIDDGNIRRILPELSRKVRTYGLSDDADIQGYALEHQGLQTAFKVMYGEGKTFDVVLNIPGKHNVRNALAAIAIGLELGVSVADIQTALSEFSGVGRRFEVYPDRFIGQKRVTLVDDYGHHPTELMATLDTAKTAFPHQRLVLVFQPHRFSRTRDLFDEFIQAFLQADLLILLDVYPAGEQHLPAFDSKALLQALRLRGYKNGVHVENDQQLTEIVNAILEDDDLVLVMGAGDVGQIAKTWKEQINFPEEA